MKLIRGITERFKALFRRGREEAEMVEEVRFHLEMEAEKNVRRGMDPTEARREARVAFGGVERFKEKTRDERGVRPLEDLISDLKFSFRTLRKNPGFTAVAILSLALGIGANTAIFSVVNAMLIRELPFEAPEELVNIYRDRARGDFDPMNYPDYLEAQEGTSQVFTDLGGYQFAIAQRETQAGVETVIAQMITGNFLPLLGVGAAIGRTILPEDHVAPGAHPVVMLGYRYWQNSFGGDPDVLGQTVLISGRSFTIVGVAPQDFPGSIRGLAPEFFAPIMMINEIMPGGGNPLESRGTNSFMSIGRLREGATAAQAQVALTQIAEHLKSAFPGNWDQGDALIAEPTEGVLFNPEMDGPIKMVNYFALGVVGLVLLIACANLAGFLLARAVDRRKEVALRLAMGATRGRLIRQLITETLVLAILGGVVGIPMAMWILKLGMGTTIPFPVPIGFDLSLDWTILGFTLAVSLATGIMVGLVPALQATKPDVAPTLKDEGAGGQGSRVLMLSRSLVMGQMTMSVMLLVLAGLFIRSFDASKLLDPGFGSEPTSVLTFMIPAQEYSREEGRELLGSILEDTRALPGVSKAAAVSNIHLNPLNSMFLNVNVDGVPAPQGNQSHIVDFTSITEGFFPTAGIDMLEGRDFDSGDRLDGAPVAIINQAMADQFWPNGNAPGQVLRIEVPGWEDVTVVGVVATAKIHSLGEAPTPFLYLPFEQTYNSTLSVMAVSPTPGATAAELFRMVRERHPNLIINSSTTLEEHVGVMLIFSRLYALLASVFAAMALALSVIGLYGVVSYSVARRTKEMGVRISLGAEAWQVVFLQLRDGMKLVLIGAVVGLVLAAFTSKVLGGLLVDVSSFDGVIYAGAIGVLTSVTAVAAYLPARRASRVNPVVALKSE